jgi:hypothetical protein
MIAMCIMIFQFGLGLWYAVIARDYVRGPGASVEISMVYWAIVGTFLASGLASMGFFSILCHLDGRIRRLEQLRSQLPPTGEPGNRP